MIVPVVKVEVGATAKANLDLKAEVPSGLIQRFGDAFLDAISPFTERRGLEGDQLRLERKELAAAVARAANETIILQGKTPGYVPPKVLVPLLENASLEEEGSELLDWWTSLLAAASTDIDKQHPIFIEMLSHITAREAKFLQIFSERYFDDERPQWPGHLDLQAHFVELVSKPSNILMTSTQSEEHNEKYKTGLETILDMYCDELTRIGCIISIFSFSAIAYFRRDDLNVFSEIPNAVEVLDVLISVGVMRRSSMHLPIPTPFIGEFLCVVEVTRLTVLGQKLLEACLPVRGHRKSEVSPDPSTKNVNSPAE